jgi:hypothetical protein
MGREDRTNIRLAETTIQKLAALTVNKKVDLILEHLKIEMPTAEIMERSL